jgi:RND family efflux transporter MFP subunit
MSTMVYRNLQQGSPARVLVTGLLVFIGLSGHALDAHENHAPLPTRGVKIAGDTIMLSDKAREAIGLTTAKIEFGDMHRVIVVNARVEIPWDAQAMIASLVSGKVARVLVRPGEAVGPGQELAHIVSSELESLQRALLQTRTELALATKLADQRSTLDQQGIIAGKTLLEAQATLTSKTAALEMARQKLRAIGCDATAIQAVEATQKPLEYISITSPRGGVIVHADVRIGQLVSPTDHLYHVVDTSRLWIVGDVLESDVRFMEKGQTVEAQFADQPEVRIQGTIDHVRMRMDSRKRTQEVVVLVDNHQGNLRPGMFGHLEISVNVVKEAVICPTDAVIRSRTGTYLLVQRMPGKYENRRAQLGLTDNDRVEVLDGVFPGDQVVVLGNALLAALLGNEHKARIAPDSPAEVIAPDEPVVAVAHGMIELPTDHQVLATPQVEGRVRRILVQPSQQVSAGDVLAEIDSLQLRTVQLDFLQTLSMARLRKQSLDRLEALSGTQVVPRRQLWELENERQTLELQADGFKRQLAFWGFEADAIQRLEQADWTQDTSWDALLQAVPVRAAQSGCIVRFAVVPGQVVHRDETLFEIHDLSRVWVKGYVFERDANRVTLGQSAQVRFAAYPTLQAKGQVVRISPTMDESERVLPVWVEVANPDHLLKDGMLASVKILATQAAGPRSDDAPQIVPVEAAQ